MTTIADFGKMKRDAKKIVMITCYDYTSALIVEKTKVDCMLVGDSSSMLMHGAPNTTHSTLEEIQAHTKAVARGAGSKFIIADLPFMTYHKSQQKTMEAVETLIRSGAHGVKLEGGNSQAIEAIQYIVGAGVPVMGHLGLTPQHIHQLGGFKVQGKNSDTASAILKQAKALEEAGCFSLVLECIPSSLAKKISQELTIPTIGIGAGPDTDGQVLVFHDLLGLQTAFKPKFLKRYLNGAELFESSINQYAEEVKTRQFPTDKYSYQE